MKDSQQFLSIKAKTWTRDSHGLFDYESNTVKENILIIQNPTKIIRHKHEVKEIKCGSELEVSDQPICDVGIKNSKFILSTELEYSMQPSEANINELQNKIWFIIKPEVIQGGNSNQNNNIQNENDSFDLKLNDIVKLGRVKYVITDLCLNGVITSIEDTQSKSIFKLIHEHQQVIDNPDIQCIVCFNHFLEDDPLINLCTCNQAMSVHYECVKKWINTKLSIKQNNSETVTSYNMKSFNCSICKTPYPLRFRYNNAIRNLIDYMKPENKNYMILESLNQVKDGNNYKSIHVMTLELDNKITMGRGHEADIRINDISVSRMHGTITLLNDNRIQLRDLNSKFGTLALIQRDFEVSEKKVCLQIGRSYIECRQAPLIQINRYLEEKKQLEKSLKEKQSSHKIENQIDCDKFDFQRIQELIVDDLGIPAVDNRIFRPSGYLSQLPKNQSSENLNAVQRVQQPPAETTPQGGQLPAKKEDKKAANPTSNQHNQRKR